MPANDVGQTSHAELARALSANSDWAASETWHRFAPAIVKLATRTLGSAPEAEDAAQEIFYRIFAKANTLRDAERLPGFIFAFAIRVLKTELRRKKTHARVLLQPPDLLMELDGGVDIENIEARDVLRRFDSLLNRLKPRYRQAFVLRHIQSMQVDEVAAEMDLSIATVKRTLDGARTRLSRWIDADRGLSTFLDGRGWYRSQRQPARRTFPS